MQKNHINKSLVIGIIIFFIGISLSSAVFVYTKSTILNNENVEAYCYKKVCKTDLFKVEKLQNRVVIFNKIFLMLSKYKTKLPEIGKELSREVTRITEIYEKLNLDSTINDRPYCDWLYYKYEYYLGLSVYYRDLAWNYKKNDNPFIGAIYDIISDFFGYLSIIYNMIYYGLDCQHATSIMELYNY